MVIDKKKLKKNYKRTTHTVNISQKNRTYQQNNQKRHQNTHEKKTSYLRRKKGGDARRQKKLRASEKFILQKGFYIAVAAVYKHYTR